MLRVGGKLGGYRPHPMIDPAARLELLAEHAADEEVAAIILDVVLGYGANPNPAATLAPAVHCGSGAARQLPREVLASGAK